MREIIENPSLLGSSWEKYGENTMFPAGDWGELYKTPLKGELNLLSKFLHSISLAIFSRYFGFN